VELHLHIEGTLEPELRFALAERNGIRLAHPDVAELRASYRFNDLTSFLVSYYEAMQVLVTADDFHDLVWAYLRRAHDENVRYVEMFFDPQAHTSRGVAFDTIVGGLRRAIVAARQQLGLRAELIMCFLRDHSAESAMATLVQSLPYREWIVGVGLDSDERDNPRPSSPRCSPAPGRRAIRSRCTVTWTRRTRSSTFASASKSSEWTGSTTG